jgi:NAD(P)-dependent dehydrogenase (short-subunit alcohol dehydrogenase family)
VPELPAPFSMEGRVAVITGGAGLLGGEHGAALLEIGAHVVLLDVDAERLDRQVERLSADAPGRVSGIVGDLTRPATVDELCGRVVTDHGRVDALVNNAANNPSLGAGADAVELSRLENLDEAQWLADLAVGLSAALYCSRSFGGWMAQHDGGAILNIASDLAVIAPDQRLYAETGRPPEAQPVKPVSYSVVKSGLLGLTRYLSTYWAREGVRANALSPGGVFDDQPAEFLERIGDRIPMGRMARRDEYRSAVQFLCSDASSYMTGQNLVVDGGRTAW